jgi:hypothetical protein
MGAAARARVLDAHTAEQRAIAFEQLTAAAARPTLAAPARGAGS